jgi:hypothetical protein
VQKQAPTRAISSAQYPLPFLGTQRSEQVVALGDAPALGARADSPGANGGPIGGQSWNGVAAFRSGMPVWH